jgi:hypothetical protein
MKKKHILFQFQVLSNGKKSFNQVCLMFELLHVVTFIKVPGTCHLTCNAMAVNKKENSLSQDRAQVA